MIVWGDALVKELSARRCIVFTGAGVSAGCQATVGVRKPPKWDGLLNELTCKIRNQNEIQILAENLITEKKFLDAAEVIVSALNHADYVDAMRQIFDIPRYQQSSLHEAILKIDPKILITTNYDTIYDRYCQQGQAAEGYNVFKYTDHHLVGQLRSPIRCVIKAHGCITDPDSIVLTRSNYFHAKQKYPHFFRTLDALFLTHTIIFIGYSLGDPDIQIALENANISAPSSHKHYFVTNAGTPEALKKAAERTYNLEFIEYKNGDFTDLAESVAELADRVMSYRTENPDI
jgi:hypothetical protein